MNKKAQGAILFILIVALFSIFVVGTLYIFMDKPWHLMHDVAATAPMSAEGQDVLAKIDNVWQNWPIITIVCILFGTVIWIAKSSPDTGQYQ